MAAPSPRSPVARRPSAPLRIAGIYLAAGLVWVCAGDLILVASDLQDTRAFVASVTKGVLFVVGSGALVYWLVRREVQRQAAADILMHAVLDHTTDAVFVKDLDGRYLLVNEAGARCVGQSIESILGRTDAAFFDAPSAQFLQKRDREVMAKGTVDVAQEELGIGGRQRIYLASKAPIHDADGKLLGLVGISRDVTEERRVETALRENEARLRLFIEHAPAAIAVFDRDMRYLVASRRWRDDYRLGERAIAGMSHYEVFPEIGDEWKRLHVRAMSGEVIRCERDRFVRADGSVQWLWWEIRPWLDTTGSIGGIAMLTEEITGLVQAEGEIKEKDEWLRLAYESADLGVWRHDLQTDTVQLDVRALTQFDFATGKVPFGELLARLHPNDRERFVTGMAKARAADGDGRFASEFRIVPPTGPERWLSVQVSVHTAPGSSGRAPDHAYGVCQDVTSRHLLEEQFRQAQKMEAFGRLAGGVAHDFNNLLTVINGHCDLLRLELDPSDARWPQIAAIQEAGQRAAGLTAQLLAFSRNAAVAPRVLDLVAAVTHSATMLRRLIGEHVRLTLRSLQSPCWIEIDPSQLDQILLNLVVNSRDAMPTGGTLTLDVRRIDLEHPIGTRHGTIEPGRYVQLSVQDTGCGMSEEVQARLFEPFFTTKDVGKGTGLGLAVVHGVLQRARGHVLMESESGVGSTFRLLFPAADAPATPEPAASRTYSGGTETVLLVEDDESVRSLSNLVLRGQGYRVLATANGREALAVLAQNPGQIRLLITDVVMPGMSGRELADAVRKVAPDVRIMFVSGYTGDVVFEQGVLAAGDDFLQKPFSPLALARKVRDVLDAPGLA